MSQANEIIDLYTLCEATGQRSYEVLRGLVDLQEQGLVDARRLRLTLSGLVVAQSLSGRQAAKLPKGRDAAADCAAWFNAQGLQTPAARPSTSRRKPYAA